MSQISAPLILPLVNKLLIKPDPDITGANSLVRDKWTYSVTGTVAYAPTRLYCFYDQVRAAKPDINPAELFKIGTMAQESMATDTNLEVKAGDRVFFSYLCQNEKRVTIEGEEFLLVRYDALICKIDPLYPLNGYLIVRMDEVEDRYGFFKDVNNYGMAEVVATGEVVSDIYGNAGDPSIKVGDMVIFEKNRCVRLEVDEYKTLNDGNQSSLFRVMRKHIFAKT